MNSERSLFPLLVAGACFAGLEVPAWIEDQHLVLAPPEEPLHRLLYQGAHVFVSERDSVVRVRFELEGERAVSFVLEERGAESVARRVD